MTRLQSDRHAPDQTREDREQTEDAAFARRMAHLPEQEMRSFKEDEDLGGEIA